MKDKFKTWRNRYGKFDKIRLEGNKIMYPTKNEYKPFLTLSGKELEAFNKLAETEKKQFLSDAFNFYMAIND